MPNAFLAVILVLAAYEHALAGGAAFVSTQGSDTSNNCLASAAPCRTLAHAAAVGGSSIEHIYMAGGTYKDDVAAFQGLSSITIRGSYDETFTTQDVVETPTVLTSPKARPLTFNYDGTPGTVTVESITISKSAVPLDEADVVGGGMKVYARNANVTVNLTAVNLVGNKTYQGGGFYFHAVDGAQTTLNITDSSFTKNKAERCGALEIRATNAPPTLLTVTRSTFDGNSAKGMAGGICITGDDPTLTEALQVISGSVFTKNKGDTGGALYFHADRGHLAMLLENSVFIGNKAEAGGAVFVGARAPAASEAAVHLESINNTLNANSSPRGGAFSLFSSNEYFGASDATVSSTNDIVFGNKPETVRVVPAFGGTAQLSRQYGIYDGESVGNIVDGPSVLAADPLFVKKKKDLRLAAGSPAVDSGSCAVAPDTDIDGNTRPTGGGCDMGAYEQVP